MLVYMQDHARTDLDELGPPWRAWAEARPTAAVIHVDAAAAGRSSTAVRAAMAGHLLDEAAGGAYVAEAAAQPLIEGARATLANLLAVPVDGVAFVESASAGRDALLSTWPFEEGDTVSVLPSEWGPNLAAFQHRGLAVRELAVDGAGVIDVAALEGTLRRDPPAVVHLTQLSSHRALAQPVADVVAVCVAGGVPVWVDAAQALGHVDTACGADAVYANSRKWLAGPRGVGVLGVAERHWTRLRMMPQPFAAGQPPMRNVESHEANIAGRVGLALALGEYSDVGLARVPERLREVGRATREALADVSGWEVVDVLDAPGAITSLRPTAGQDVVATRARLLDEHAVLTSACSPARAPREMTEPLLRVSPHVDATPSMLAAVAAALTSIQA